MTKTFVQKEVKKVGGRSVTERPTVLLLSSHPLILSNLQRLLAGSAFKIRVQRLDSMSVSGTEPATIPRADVHVIDANMPVSALEDFFTGILKQQPAARLIVLAEKFEEGNAFPLLRLGAKGLLSYSEAETHLARALQSVGEGGFWVPRALLSRFVDSILGLAHNRIFVRGPTLTRREQEVLNCLLANLSNKEIAGKLEISERTVKYHVSNVLSKFRVQRRADLIVLSFQGMAVGP